MRIIRDILAAILLAATSFVCGYSCHQSSSQDANNLLDAGFIILDPEGYAVERFDCRDYWTQVPKRIPGDPFEGK